MDALPSILDATATATATAAAARALAAFANPTLPESAKKLRTLTENLKKSVG
jgi:hypothetical protein